MSRATRRGPGQMRRACGDAVRSTAGRDTAILTPRPLDERGGLGCREVSRRESRRLGALLALMGAMALALALPSAVDARVAYSHSAQFGGTGTLGEPGLFHNTTMPQRIAVHEASGKLFVADRGNHRIQVFEPAASSAQFDFQISTPAPVGVAIDQGTGALYVTHPAAAKRSELQIVTVQNASSGTYTLSFGGQTTAPIPYNAAAAAVQTALQALSTVGAGNATVIGTLGDNALRTRNVTFVGTLDATDVAQITADVSDLNPGATVAVRTALDGGPAAPAAIEKLLPDDPDDPTGYSRDGAFTSPSVGAGQQIGGVQSGTDATMASGGGVAVDPTTGNLLVVDTGKNLIQRFSPTGTHLGDFNGATGGRSAFTGIRDLAVTSAGDIIVADVIGNQGRIDRFNASGILQATLSQNNTPVPNPSVAASLYNWAITLSVNSADEVLVSSVNTGPFAALLPVSRIYQFASDVYVGDFTAPANFAGPIYGISTGAHPARLYALAAHQLPGPYFGAGIPRVQVFNAAVPPTATIADVTDVTATGATFRGTVNPNGSSTSWRFEYRPTGGTSWSSLPVPDGGPLDGGDELPVQATAASLQPNTQYEVRLIATAPGGVVTVSAEPNPTFTTSTVAPVVMPGTAAFIGPDRATLTGGVNPRNASATYWFEYGPDDAYGTTVPLDPAPVGSGNVRVTVSQAIQGLEPGTTYHFRLVARNGNGQVSHSNDVEFTTLADTPEGLGAPRVWELVTRLPTGGVLIESGGTASEDGQAYFYKSHHTHVHYPWLDEPHNTFIAVRDTAAWDVAPVGLPAPSGFGQLLALSPNMSSALAQDQANSHHPDDQNQAGSPMPGLDLYMQGRDGNLQWVSRSRLSAPGEPQTDGAALGVTGAPKMSSLSLDGRVAVFSSGRRLLEQDPFPSAAVDLPTTRRLYKWSSGDLELISITPGGTPVQGATLGSSGNSPHAVSRDGSRVFWRHGTTIYAHIADHGSIEVGQGEYADATSDGSRVIFHGDGRLRSFDVDTRAGHDLTGPAGVLGVAAVSERADHVYFVATSAMDADPSPFGDVPEPGANNLYLVELSESGTAKRTQFIATLGGSDATTADGGVWEKQFDLRAAAVAPDGRTFTFGSVKALTGGLVGSSRQAYVYDAGRNALDCLSCAKDMASMVTGNANAYVNPGDDEAPGTNGWSSINGYQRLVATDGRVFFSTKNVLAREDENRTRDVYEYRNGDIRLVTRGAPGDRSTELAGISRDGTVAFFSAANSLVPQDDEGPVRKIYAARVGEGFPSKPKAPPCSGDNCLGSPSQSPPPAKVGSDRGAGYGNMPSTPRTRRPSITVSGAKLAMGSTTSLRVRVPGRGRIAIGGASVRGLSRVAKRAGTYTVRITLSARAGQRLKRRGAFKARVRVAYRSVRGWSTSKTLTVTFKKRTTSDRVKAKKGDR